ncbi:RNA polymerase-associated RTF1-like protein [Chlorella sorokiniana]|uniref:RNA polymerase-associated RTF1-like protein n=1 Tax=Chlorella sorokiniana TaxID=3076 RepID=A0A2P6TI52_CHLSO|nr:RNA polymerase-associated RTF1-like protein [Chlorella sorokiniana]|eukprot:PRW33968.1 RNA polymerase-associated RTF1-like protein [Chlorella sorokiniana]
MADSDSSIDSELVRATKKGGKKRKAVSDSEYEESDESVSLEEESEWEEEARSKKKGSGQKPARKKPARRGGRQASPSDEDEDDEDFEEEAAAPSARGGGRRGRQQQESSDDEDRLQIDEEDLIEDEEDRKRLAAMTELQREFVLAERADKRNAELLRQKLLKKNDAKAAAAGAKAAKTNDAKAAAAGAKAAKTVRGKSGREEREEAGKKRAIEELKAARERKKEGAEERRKKDEDEDEDMEVEEADAEAAERREARRRERERSPSEEGALDSDEALSDDDRGAYGRRRYEEGEDEEDEAPMEDVKKIQVRRLRLEEWVNEPFFDDTLPGCMVRVVQPGGEHYGPDGQLHRRYLLCQVLAVESRQPGYYKDAGERWPCPYSFGDKKIKTDKWLLLERGTSQRYFPMALVSNTGFSDQEFDSWQRSLKDAGRPQVSRRVARDVLGRLDKAAQYTYTAADVNRLLQEKRAKGAAPRNVALEKARLENELGHARETGEDARVAELEAQLAALQGLTAETEQTKRRGKDLASLNKRNAEANFKAALDNVSNKVGGAAGAQGGAEATALDPFSRRATRPIIYWSTGRKQAEDAAAEAAQQGAAAANGDANGTAAAGDDEDLSPEEQKRRARRGGLDLDAIVDLSQLDLSILQRPARMPPLARKLLGPTWRPAQPPPGARIVSLEEFKHSHGWA